MSHPDKAIRRQRDWEKLCLALQSDQRIVAQMKTRGDLKLPSTPDEVTIDYLCDEVLAEVLRNYGIEYGEINDYGRAIDDLIGRTNRFRLCDD